MDINYRMMPTDYIQELQALGKREKARCFMEYFMDMQMGCVNSIGFYAKSWGTRDKPKSKGSVHKWIQEFVLKIESFYNIWSIKNKSHYSSVKKQSERQVNDYDKSKTPQSTATPSFDDDTKKQSERQVNKDYNINNNNTHTRRFFDDFYFIYRLNNSYAGSKEKAWESWRKLDIESLIDNVKAISLAGLRYCHDSCVDRKVGAKKFLEDEIYLNYMSVKISVLIGEKWIRGIYDSKSQVFTDENDNSFRLDVEDMILKYTNQELIFER